MLGAALGHRVGKLGEPLLPHQMHVLDLHIAGRAAGLLQQEIHPRILAVFHLAAHAAVAGELRNEAGRDRLGGERIRIGRIDADQFGPAAEIDLDQLPAVAELALGIVGPRQPHRRARRRQPDHRARIGAMHRHGLAARQRDIRQKSLVAPDQSGGDERASESHAPV